MREQLKGHLDLLLLAAVEAGPAHGYAIAQALRARSDGVFDLGEGTLYPALRRLEDAGLLRSTWTTVQGRRRRVYELTPRGRNALADQAHEWQRFAHGVGSVLGGARWEPAG